MTAETLTVQQLAEEAAAWFETAKRGGDAEDAERFTRTRDGAPEWITELVHDAHGDMLPDDWRYACISAALDAIAENDDPDDGAQEFADGYVDVYTSNLIEWLGSHGSRQGYCDEAVAEFGIDPTDDGIVKRMQLGQYAEAEEVYHSVRQSLDAELSARELDELTEDDEDPAE